MAGLIWKNLGNNQKSLEKLYMKMNHYKLKTSPYDVNYSSEDSPRLWWLGIDDERNNPLQQLALLMLDITPHSASCERNFSALGGSMVKEDCVYLLKKSKVWLKLDLIIYQKLMN